MLESRDGNLFISAAKDRNITLKILGDGYVNVNEINLLHVASAVWDEIFKRTNATSTTLMARCGIIDPVSGTKRHALDRKVENGISGRGGVEFATAHAGRRGT